MILLFHNFLHFAKLLNKKYGTHTESRILHLHKIFYSAEKVEPYYSISMPTDDVEKRAVLFQKLIEIGTLFSNGKDWSPSEIVRYYGTVA